MKKKWLVFMGSCMYLMQVIFIVMIAAGDSEYAAAIIDNGLWAIVLLTAVATGLVIANILSAVFGYRRVLLQDASKGAFGMAMAAKLVLVPFYIFNFILWIVLVSISVHPFFLFFGGWIIWILAFFAMLFAYSTVLATSSYIIAQLFALRKRGEISVIELIIHALLQFICIADTVDAVYLTLKYPFTTPPPHINDENGGRA